MTLLNTLGNMGQSSWLTIDGQPGLSVPWTEAYHATGEFQPAAFSYEGGNQVPVTIYTPFSSEPGFATQVVGQLLGFHEFVGAGLSRTPELPHRLFNTMFVVRITDMRPYGPGAKDNGLLYGPVVTAPYWRISMICAQPKVNRTWSDRKINAEFGHEVIGGVAVYQEWQRYCIYEWDPGTTVIVAPNGYFVWAEGAGGAQPVTGNPLDAQPGVLLGEPDLLVTWTKVPAKGLFDSTGKPTNILNGVGCVNDSPFMNNPAGTMLLLPPRFIPVESPVAWGGALAPGVATLCYSVQFPFKIFDTTGARQGAATVGHNTSMWSDARFYGIKSKNGGNPPLPTYSFPKLFQGNTT